MPSSKDIVRLAKATRLGAVGALMFLLGTNAGSAVTAYDEPYETVGEYAGTGMMIGGPVFMVLGAFGVGQKKRKKKAKA